MVCILFRSTTYIPSSFKIIVEQNIVTKTFGSLQIIVWNSLCHLRSSASTYWVLGLLSTDLSRSSLLLRWIKSKVLHTQFKTVNHFNLIIFTCLRTGLNSQLATDSEAGRRTVGVRYSVLFWREMFPFDRNVCSLRLRNLSKVKAFYTLNEYLTMNKDIHTFLLCLSTIFGCKLPT